MLLNLCIRTMLIATRRKSKMISSFKYNLHMIGNCKSFRFSFFIFKRKILGPKCVL